MELRVIFSNFINSKSTADCGSYFKDKNIVAVEFFIDEWTAGNNSSINKNQSTIQDLIDYQTNSFSMKSYALLKLIKDNVQSQQQQPQSLSGSSDSDDIVGSTPTLTNSSEHVKDAADTDKVLAALATKYPGHIVKTSNSGGGGDFIWFNYGGSISKIMVVHASFTELVAIVKFPFGNSSLYSAPLPQETYSFIMKGECLTCTDCTLTELLLNQKV
ncbi:hypothetical protein PPL_09409 [Heterostelium album PN500]|uniref:Uncharacterized protein n=1 Tax=Heterostelium pallidum (strain ATCC 26659 / Pp 5 / PN500) TaxID=670386 RepID=D3BPE1_HETP5|nr:hypothetical protein PPL_09409 [Heterostelium album PN500]EFA76659.1 hypothetical protein PPL_09409 [Heterostelium album PN500]|eukprot:XP_020428791.1 hypothetical protein PPL_09409 [Heterostelium album PN500]